MKALTILILIIGSLLANQKMTIFTNGEEVTYSVDVIDSITFSEVTGSDSMKIVVSNKSLFDVRFFCNGDVSDLAPEQSVSMTLPIAPHSYNTVYGTIPNSPYDEVSVTAGSGLSGQFDTTGEVYELTYYSSVEVEMVIDTLDHVTADIDTLYFGKFKLGAVLSVDWQ